jgi:hypothetical protein
MHGGNTRLTFDGGGNLAPVWSPDGNYTLPSNLQAAFFALCLRFVFFTADPARLTAHRRLIASARRSRPSDVRRGFRRMASDGGAGAASAVFLAAHRFFCPSDRWFRREESGLRVTGPAEAGAVATGAATPSTSRSAASARSTAAFCRSSCVMMLVNPSVILL